MTTLPPAAPRPEPSEKALDAALSAVYLDAGRVRNPEILRAELRHALTSAYAVDLRVDEPRGCPTPGAIEGIVWHHPDGRMVKIKAKDFGFKRGSP